MIFEEVRPPLHAQRGWYPRDPDELNAYLEQVCASSAQGETVLGVVSPHAGYQFSGAVAGAVYARVKVPDSVIVVGVGHRPTVRPNTIGVHGSWAIPGANVPIDQKLAKALGSRCSQLEIEAGEQRGEHSLELQIPFLHHRNPALRIVPIQVRELNLMRCLEMGRQIAEVIREWPEPVLLVASTDMHHQQRAAGLHTVRVVEERSQRAIDKLVSFDPESLFEVVRTQSISMCGVLPTTIVLAAARALGGQHVEPIDQATSFDVSGDDSYVVGYFSAIVR